MATDPGLAVLELIFPKEIFEWFDIVSGIKDDKTVSIVFEEKNNPPLSDSNKKIISKGFTDITITDFPIRGRKTLLTFRRRYWKIEGQKKYLYLCTFGKGSGRKGHRVVSRRRITTLETTEVSNASSHYMPG